MGRLRGQQPVPGTPYPSAVGRPAISPPESLGYGPESHWAQLNRANEAIRELLEIQDTLRQQAAVSEVLADAIERVTLYGTVSELGAVYKALQAHRAITKTGL